MKTLKFVVVAAIFALCFALSACGSAKADGVYIYRQGEGESAYTITLTLDGDKWSVKEAHIPQSGSPFDLMTSGQFEVKNGTVTFKRKINNIDVNLFTGTLKDDTISILFDGYDEPLVFVRQAA